MKKTVKFMALVLAIVILATTLCSCSKAVESTPVKPEDFRVTAYLVCNENVDINELDYSHLSQITDFILFGAVTFDENGNVSVNDNLHQWVDLIKKETSQNPNVKYYINILGPGSQSKSDDWYDQMDDMSERHDNAFESGKLENNIKATLEEYGVDGIFFDYEYPIKGKYWKSYDKFLVSLDNVLGDDYLIGSSVASWNLKQSKEGIATLDLVTIMSYDLWDEEGDHASIELAKDDIDKVKKAGYDLAKCDLGLPFYARPTTKEAFWYNYKDFYKDMDAQGFYQDADDGVDNQEKTGLKFKFNTPQMISDKTKIAIDEGVGGVMVWHYSCDVPSGDSMSLFDAIYSAKQDAIKAQQ